MTLRCICEHGLRASLATCHVAGKQCPNMQGLLESVRDIHVLSGLPPKQKPLWQSCSLVGWRCWLFRGFLPLLSCQYPHVSLDGLGISFLQCQKGCPGEHMLEQRLSTQQPLRLVGSSPPEVGSMIPIPLGVASPFCPGILLSRKPPKTRKQLVIEKNDG